MIKIKIFGDIALNLPCAPSIVEGTFHSNSESLIIANLETPIVSPNIEERAKAGPVLRGQEAFFLSVFNNQLQTCLNLANNHMMDYGEKGLDQTLALCEKLNLYTVGTGTSISQARLPLIFQVDGYRVGILGRCESQFGIADCERPGVASIEPSICTAITALKRQVDVVIISVHGGAEMSPWPSPKWQDLLRSFIEAGADIIHGHHSHIPQGYELYNHGIIFYGMGNFLVDPNRWQQHPNALWSLSAEIDMNKSGYITHKIQTSSVRQNGNQIIVRENSFSEAQKCQIYLEKCNQPLANRSLLIGLWQETSVRLYKLYFSNWLKLAPKPIHQPGVRGLFRQLGTTFYHRIFNFHSNNDSIKTLNTSISTGQYLLWYHLFACESHNEAIATALGVLGGELEDRRTIETARLADEMMPWSVEAASI